MPNYVVRMKDINYGETVYAFTVTAPDQQTAISEATLQSASLIGNYALIVESVNLTTNSIPAANPTSTDPIAVIDPTNPAPLASDPNAGAGTAGVTVESSANAEAVEAPVEANTDTSSNEYQAVTL